MYTVSHVFVSLAYFNKLRGQSCDKYLFFIIHLTDKYSKQNMNTFRENVLVCEDFLSTVKKKKL